MLFPSSTYIVAPSVRCVEQIGIDAPLPPPLRRRFRRGRPKLVTGSNNVKKVPPSPLQNCHFSGRGEGGDFVPRARPTLQKPEEEERGAGFDKLDV